MVADLFPGVVRMGAKLSGGERLWNGQRIDKAGETFGMKPGALRCGDDGGWLR
jgi:hypothetical protein